MQRKDVQIGVEYAATAPLAYGRVPRDAVPRRVRFTDTRPGPWLRVITTEYSEHGSFMSSGAGWNTVETKIVSAKSPEGIQALNELPHSQRDAMLAKYGVTEHYERKTISGKVEPATRQSLPHPLPAKYGERITYVDSSIKGGLPGEVLRWREGEPTWTPTLVQPADIHQTWAEIQTQREVKAAQEAVYDEVAKVAELRELLSLVGLADLFQVRRSGSRRVAIESLGRNGDVLLADLTTWAAERGLIAKVEV